MTKEKIQYLYKNYPEYVTQKEFMEICGICQKTAYLLNKSGLVPYERIIQGKLHFYRISLEDIIAYLTLKEYQNRVNSDDVNRILSGVPDVLSTSEVSCIAGVGKSCVKKWIASGKLTAFRCKGDYRITKEALKDAMLSGRCRRKEQGVQE